MTLRALAILELSYLVRLSLRTGEPVRDMIAVPDDVRAALEEFCVHFPSDAAWVQESLDLRDLMLDYVDRMPAADLAARFGRHAE